uniref:N-acetyltransferase domain-containing protein n=1 Tax=Tetraselmis chuii TaxID=63592 RepID=A0A7S1SPQ7_9CHLO|mmetsp:Transcript_21921/g.39086  ORF Transcript_21921/g.39086 Transcript_21921/m.39086 type:complete len:143 (+) Transcript_21921:566-994(+)
MMIGGGGVVGTMDVVAVVGGVSVRDGECSEAGEDGTSSAAYMANLCVHPNARRQSIGVRMIEYARCVAALWGTEVLFVEVEVSNSAAISMYAANGFVERSRRQMFGVATILLEQQQQPQRHGHTDERHPLLRPPKGTYEELR